MRTLITTCFALLLGLVMMPDMAEAKRLGGGSSFGKSYTTPKRVAPAPSKEQTATTPTGKTGTTTGTRSKGFGGLLGGLLAGGLLAALFMGGAFEGIQFMDILLIAVIGFVLFKLFARRKVQQPQPAYATPDGGMMRQQPEPQPAGQPAPAFGGAGNAGLAANKLNLPEWFNEKAFVDGAQQHFIHLQKAWDTQDWSEIRDYMSDEMFEALQQERAKLPAQQHTEVDSVMAELVNFIDEGDHVVASIHFYGWIAESGQPTSEFSEIWHLSRDMQVAGADWKIVGIEQTS